MRSLAKLFVFSFSVLHRLVMVVIAAHVFLVRNLFTRHPHAGRPAAVKRG